MYRPNFCADCGERIYRRRWRFWTSRRFCQKCATRLRRALIFTPLLGVLALLSVAFLAGRAGRPAPPPLIIEQATLPPLAPVATITSDSQTANNASSPTTTQPQLARVTSADALTDPNELVSICGARTKKGAPCSRRVRGVGRCWQHRGKPAMLSAGKLVIK